jgi:hypothetical protein
MQAALGGGDIDVDAGSSLPVKIRFTTLSDPAHPDSGEDVFAKWATVKGIWRPSHPI